LASHWRVEPEKLGEKQALSSSRIRLNHPLQTPTIPSSRALTMEVLYQLS